MSAKPKARLRIHRLLAWLAIVAFAPAADQAAYPSGPIRLVVPFPAGGPASLVAHTIGERLSTALGEPVIVDNRSGAGGNLGTQIVAKAAPDGQTLLLGTNGPLVVNVSLYDLLPFDPVKDFAPISYIASIPLVLIAHPSVPADTVAQLVALAKQKPGQLSYASSGSGSGGHLAGALLAAQAGIEIVHVPYRGAAPATTDLIGGHVPLMVDGLTAALPYIRADKVKALGVATPHRAAAAPDIPTIAEQGLPGYQIDSWYGILAPAGTPPAIIERLHREIVRILDLPEVTDLLFVKNGLERVGSTPEAFGATIRKQIPEYQRIVRISGAHAD